MVHHLIQDYHSQQSQIINELKSETNNEEMCSWHINHLVKRIFQEKELQADAKCLLSLHKIAIRISKNSPRNVSIWARLSPKTKALLCTVLPYQCPPQELKLQYMTHENSSSYSYVSFSGSIFQVQPCGNKHNHQFFNIANRENKLLATYDSKDFPVSYLGGLGAKSIHKCAENPKESWFVLSMEPDISLKEWCEKNTSLEERKPILDRIIFLLDQEKEFGVPLFNLNSSTLIHIFKKRVYISDLNNLSTEFIQNLNVRHEHFFNRLILIGLKDISISLQSKYDPTKCGPFESLYNKLLHIFSCKQWDDVNFFEPQSQARELAYLLYKYQSFEQRLQDLPLKRFHHISSLIRYLRLVIRAAMPNPIDPYIYAKKLIQNIPKKKEVPSLVHLCKTVIIRKIPIHQFSLEMISAFDGENSTFITNQKEAILMLTRTCFSMIVKEFIANDLTIEETIENFCNLPILINYIKNQLDEDSLHDKSLKPISESDGVSTSGEYFEILFWEGFLDDLSRLVDEQSLDYPQNPFIDLVYARFLQNKVPDRNIDIAELRINSLKLIAKNAAKKKLASKLKSRLEKFQIKK